MKLPADTVIPRANATDYLLIPQARGDKSAFLEQAGYTLENAELLLRDLRAQLLPLEAVPGKSNQFGIYYETRGNLTGPNGVTLAVRAIWMTEHLSRVTKFVTLLPDKRRTG
jgi:hypothetical protein